MITILDTHDNNHGSTVKLAKVGHMYDIIIFHNNGSENTHHVALANIESESDARAAFDSAVTGLTSVKQFATAKDGS